RLSLQPHRAVELFDGLVATGLLVRRGGQYGNTDAVTCLLERVRDGVQASHNGKWLWLLPIAVAVAVTLVAVQGWSHPHHRPLTTVEAARPLADQQAAPPARTPSVGDDTTTYVLVSSREQADTVSRDLQANYARLAPF